MSESNFFKKIGPWNWADENYNNKQPGRGRVKQRRGINARVLGR